MPSDKQPTNKPGGQVPTSDTLVGFDGVGLDIKGRSILRELTFAISSENLTLILGPNGAGKSMLLRLIHSLIQPTAGTIRWVDETAAHRDQQAMVFQKPVLLRRSVEANVAYPLKLKGHDKAGQATRAAEALDVAGLLDLAGQPARKLSGGEQQRLALARAWAIRPRLLLLDEPTAHLDPSSTKRIEDLVGLVKAGGTKVIMTCHDLAQARRLGDDVLFLNRGELVEVGVANAFFSEPTTDTARRFLAGDLIAD